VQVLKNGRISEEHYECFKIKVIEEFVDSGGLEIRDVDGGESPFLYSTGNHGPGYCDVKGRVGNWKCFESLCGLLFLRLILDKVEPGLIVGLVTGGLCTGIRLKMLLSEYYEKDIPFIYQRGARKVGGHQELDTGDRNNIFIPQYAETLVVEELVNFAGTTTNAVNYERKEKHRKVTGAACVLNYENPVAIRRLKINNIKLHHAFTLKEVLDYCLNQEGIDVHQTHLIHQYLNFLNNPKEWNESRGYKFYGEYDGR
jgi:orotate phosphoribosyltransferase